VTVPGAGDLPCGSSHAPAQRYPARRFPKTSALDRIAREKGGFMADALVLERISKTYGDVRAVSALSLAVPPGTIYGLLGPNGAGKTTTIRMILDIIKPDEGSIRILGESDPDRRRDLVGYLPEERGLHRKMKVREVLLYFGRLHDVSRDQLKTEAERWLERLGLAERANDKVEALSKGMQQKVQLIATFLHQPRVIVLDEPFSGLDPVNVDLVREIILELRQRGAALLLSTHQMEMVERLCDAICLIDHGRAVLQGTLAQVKAGRGARAIQIAYEGKPSFQRDRTLVARADDFGNYMEIHPAAGIEPQQILEAAVREVRIQRFQVMEPSLHQIFVETVGSSSPAAEPAGKEG